MNEIELTNIRAFIACKAQAQRVTVTGISRLSGGAVQENWKLNLLIEGGAFDGECKAVLRCDSPTAGVSISHSRDHEFALLKAAFDAGVVVPEPLWLCMDKNVIGRAFFVMRQIEGTAAGHVLVKNLHYAPDRRALAVQLGQQMARIHSIKPPREDLNFINYPQGKPALHRVNGYRQYLDTLQDSFPVIELALTWLEKHAPDTPELTLAHGDFRTGNYMVDTHGLTGVLDWEFASWSDPLEDIGWFCAKCWRFGKNDQEAGGIGLREHFYAGYEAQSGRSIPTELVVYWELMAHVTWAIIALQQAQRHLSEQENSLLLALTGHIVPELEWEMLNMLEAA